MPSPAPVMRYSSWDWEENFGIHASVEINVSCACLVLRDSLHTSSREGVGREDIVFLVIRGLKHLRVETRDNVVG